MKYILLLCTLFNFRLACSQMASSANLLTEKGIIALRPSDIYNDPHQLKELWLDDPYPLELYSEQEKENQQRINEEAVEKIVVDSSIGNNAEWTTIDREEITPYTWKWVDLELLSSEGTVTKINLRRPHWWIRQMNADSIGREIYLDIPALGSKGWATVVNIRANQLDTRVWNSAQTSNYASRPITGKFQHESSNVYSLQFAKPGLSIGVTGEHPFWSANRNTWVSTKDLEIGEDVKTDVGVVKLISREKQEGSYIVYNIEVFNDHNYHVSLSKIVVHNDKIPDNLLGTPISSFMDDFKVAGQKIFPGDPHTDAKGVKEVMDLMKSGDFDWNLTPLKDRIEILVFPNGRLQIGDGHHRIYAARLLGIDIPWANRKAITFKRIYSNPTRNLDWTDVDWTENVRREILEAAE